MIETDENGIWEVSEGKHCKIRVLTKPSKSFHDLQASYPVVEPEPARNLVSEIDNLKARIEKLEENAIKEPL